MYCHGLTSVHITDLGAWCEIDFISNPLELAHYLFLNGEEVKDLVIPNSVKKISNSAFRGCSSLVTVTIPNSVTSIGYEAFRDCSGLSSVTIGKSVASIGYEAFSGCSDLNDVYCFSPQVPQTGNDVFKNAYINYATLHVPYLSRDLYMAVEPWKNFKEIVSIGTSPAITFVDANVKALCVANWDTNGDCELSEDEAATVTDLDEVFKGKANIKSFNELSYFTGLTKISVNAFGDCRALTSITLPEGITLIDNYAFQRTGLISITIPSSVTYIGTDAFRWTQLTNVVIPDGVTTLESCCFAGCTNLTSVSIGSGVSNYNGTAFIDNPKLASIVVAPENTTYDSRNDCNAVITKNGKFLLTGCQSTIIPESVEEIGYYAFRGSSELKQIILPADIRFVGHQAFNDCPNLTSVVALPNTPPRVFDASSFSNRTNATLYVPVGCKALYESADIWKEFKEIVEMGNGEQQKCATPTIAYDKGELVFSCETEGVKFVSEVKVADAKSNEGERVQLMPTYIINVYAAKDGYDNSDVATATIQWRDGRPLLTGFSNITIDGKAANDTNGDGAVDVADIATIISEMAAQARKQGNTDM